MDFTELPAPIVGILNDLKEMIDTQVEKKDLFMPLGAEVNDQVRVEIIESAD